MASTEYNIFFDCANISAGVPSSSSNDKNNNLNKQHQLHECGKQQTCRQKTDKGCGHNVSIQVPSKHTGPSRGHGQDSGDFPLSSTFSHTVSKPNTGFSPILHPATQHTDSAPGRWSHCDALAGDELDAIAKGMRSNERLSKQMKGVRIAGRRLGKVKRKRREKESNAELGASGDRHKTRRSVKAASQDSTGDSIAEKEKKKRRRRRRKRPQPEPPPEGQVRRSESLYRLATNPCRLDPNMEHNKSVHTQFGGHITQLTEPQPKIRRRRRSNQVKDPQMDFDL